MSEVTKSGNFICSHCRNTISLRLFAQATSIACGNCRRVYLKNNQFKDEKDQFSGPQKPPYIPVGSTGIIREKPYEVVGYIYVGEKGKVYRWREYVLFNREEGFAYLSEYEGHWTYFEHVASNRKNPGKAEMYEGLVYQKYNKYTSEALHAEGEFPWNILIYEEVWEYIAPPNGLNCAKSNSSVAWTKGSYLMPNEVKAAFNLVKSAPDRYGVGALQPFNGGISYKKLWKPTATALTVLLMLQLMFSFGSHNQELASKSFYLGDSVSASNAYALPGPELTIPASSTTDNLEFKLYSDVKNSWFSTGITLIHQASGKEYDFEMGVEFYSGNSGGESWKEGSHTKEKMLSAMLPGRYDVLVYPYAPSNKNPTSFTLTILYDTPIWSNFWILALAIVLFPLVQGLREYFFERQRWSTSDYSPYTES